VEHIELYGKLRAALLSRRFAFNGPWRVNLPSNSGRLEGVATRADYDALSPDEKMQARWSTTSRQGENPWALVGASLAAALSIESMFGHAHARAVLGSLLESATAQFRFSGAFDGYPVRWDPMATAPERWRQDADGNKYSAEFPVTSARYDFANAPREFRRYPRRSRAALDKLLGSLSPPDSAFEGDIDYHRRWEISQDEIFGLLAGLYAIHQISGEATLAATAKTLTGRLADYLSRCGYLLVKPQGGLVGRGAGDSLIGSEYAIGRGFKTVLGSEFSSQTDFGGAMQLAGYWNQLKDPVALYAALGDLASVSAQLLALVPGDPTIATIVTTLNGIDTIVASACPALADAAHDWLLPAHLAKMLAVSLHSDIFDPFRENVRTEHAQSIFFYEYDRQMRYRVYSQFCALLAADKPPVSFMAQTAMLALNDHDTLVRDEFARWFGLRNTFIGASPRGPAPAQALYTQALACLLLGSMYEAPLRDALDAAKSRFENDFESDLELVEVKDDHGNVTGIKEDCTSAADYLGGLALAWLYATRRSAAGATLVGGFPMPPADLSILPRPLAADGSDLFPGDVAVARAPEPPPSLAASPDTGTTPAVDKAVVVLETNADVDTGITVHYGDVFRITASGSIRRDLSSSFNGPNGINEVNDDPNWPLHSGIDATNTKWSLLARLNGWFEIGGDSGERVWRYDCLDDHGDAARRLYLRINGDTPGKGDGAFDARVRIWGRPRLTFDRLEANTYAFVFPPSLRFALACSEACGPLHVTVTVRMPDGSSRPIVGENLGTQMPLSELLDGPIVSHPAVLEPAGEQTTIFWLGRVEGGPSLFGRNDVFQFHLQARSDWGYVASADCSVEIEWHGQQVSCIHRPPHVGHDRILAIGGVMPNTGRQWTLSEDAAIAEIERGQYFYVSQPPAHDARVIVAQSSTGHKYLKTVADGVVPNNLLSLPECGS
jgi:hypothetical protein